MWWYYKFKSKVNGVYTYYYSRESCRCDGELVYNVNDDAVKVVQLCEVDKEIGQFAEDKAAEHFAKVISANFPETIQVACG